MKAKIKSTYVLKSSNMSRKNRFPLSTEDLPGGRSAHIGSFVRRTLTLHVIQYCLGALILHVLRNVVKKHLKIPVNKCLAS